MSKFRSIKHIVRSTIILALVCYFGIIAVLSIPFILAGVFMLWYSKKLPDEGEKKGKKGKG